MPARSKPQSRNISDFFAKKILPPVLTAASAAFYTATHSPGIGGETNVEPLRKSGVDVGLGDVRDRAFLDLTLHARPAP